MGRGVGYCTVTDTFTYNAREWVTEIDYAGKFSSELTYDLAGNVTRQVYSHGSAASKTADYAYDALYRITGFDLAGGTSRDYAYDRSGNLTSVVTGSSRLNYNYSGTSTPNRLDSTAVGSTTTTYAYNQNGWMTARGANTLTYDYRGLTTGYGSARYLMDSDRRRVKKTVGTAVTYYLRGPGGNVLAEYSGQNLSANYVYAGSRRIARLAGDSASYYLADHLGSTRSLVGEEGAVTAAYDYWPYGEVLATSGSGSTHFRFTGHERDAESGLDYMLEREYAYDVGRFLRPEPMQDEFPGISPYAYANNNPLKYVDPDGRVAVFRLLSVAAEIVSTGYDAYNLYETIQDPTSTKVDVGVAATGVAVGMVLPGPGSAYTTVLKPIIKKIEAAINRVKALRSTEKPSHGKIAKPRVKKVKAVPGAGAHTSFKRDPRSGKVTGYTQYDALGRPVKRFRGEGKKHGGQDPPFILEPKPGKGPGAPLINPRNPRPGETPRGYE